MSNITVCVRFRPLNQTEKLQNDETVCIQAPAGGSFLFKAEKKKDMAFCFDRVFYQESEQEEVYDFLAKPIVEDIVSAINGTIITYGQIGSGKTYTMEGPGISDCDHNKKGLLPRVVDGLFKSIKSMDEPDKFTVKLSMVEIYMEKLRDLLDITKNNLQIEESKMQGIFLSEVTEMPTLDTEDALRCLKSGISRRAVGETQMNMSSSRSHCVYIFSVHEELPKDGRLRNGKLILVDLAGSEKVEKTGAEGRILEEAKAINKSLSALRNVVNALTKGKVNHISYRDSKLTRILQDAMGGNTRCALLCCCSPSFLNESETLSTLHFGTSFKLLKTPSRVGATVDTAEEKQVSPFPTRSIAGAGKAAVLRQVISKASEIYKFMKLAKETGEPTPVFLTKNFTRKEAMLINKLVEDHSLKVLNLFELQHRALSKQLKDMRKKHESNLRKLGIGHVKDCRKRPAFMAPGGKDFYIGIPQEFEDKYRRLEVLKGLLPGEALRIQEEEAALAPEP